MKLNLSSYHTGTYYPGANGLKRFVWYYVNSIFFKSYYFPFSSFKVLLLRCFGAVIGHGVNIKPCVNIKYPWHLHIGNYSWIGEEVWIDSLVNVTIGDNCCLSQGSMLLTGNHDYCSSSFDLIVKEIVLEDGVWIGAKSMVCPGVKCGSHCVLTVSSVATKDLEPFGVYQGNPAVKIKNREIR